MLLALHKEIGACHIPRGQTPRPDEDIWKAYGKHFGPSLSQQTRNKNALGIRCDGKGANLPFPYMNHFPRNCLVLIHFEASVRLRTMQ